MINNIVSIGEELFLIKYNLRDEYEQLAFEWNKIGPERRSFKRDGRLYLCEVIEEATIVKEEETVIEEKTKVIKKKKSNKL
jgi:hypothetical protein